MSRSESCDVFTQDELNIQLQDSTNNFFLVNQPGNQSASCIYGIRPLISSGYEVNQKNEKDQKKKIRIIILVSAICHR